jgi:hypothetical protein
MELEVQKYLRDGGTVEGLKTKYAINAIRHPHRMNLVLLKYDQLESPFAEEIVQERRGIILDEFNDWDLVCYRFKKFFNHGEGHAASIDWSSARVEEKVDGSLMTTYFYDGKWFVATSGSPDASGQVGDFPFTFKELFWNTFSDMGYRTEAMNPDLCYSFEMTSQYNRVVVRYTEPSLTLIGIHDPRWGNELDISRIKEMKIVKTYDLTSFDQIVDTFATIDPLSQEGYIVVDGQFNRVKMKNPAYVAIHHLKDGFGFKRITEIVRTSEGSEFLTYFPEYEPQFTEVQTKYDALVSELEVLYASIKDIETQKDFALAVQAAKCRAPGAMYSMRSGKVDSIKKYLREMNLDALMGILGLK